LETGVGENGTVPTLCVVAVAVHLGASSAATATNAVDGSTSAASNALGGATTSSKSIDGVEFRLQLYNSDGELVRQKQVCRFSIVGNAKISFDDLADRDRTSFRHNNADLCCRRVA
jgi:hypothetical protein